MIRALAALAYGAGWLASWLLLSLALGYSVLLFGCMSSSIVVVKGDTTLKVEHALSGRGCIAVDTTPAGRINVVAAQDGTSDWSTTRLLGFIGDLAAEVFGGGTSEGEMQAPSTAAGCAQIFESAPEPL